MKVLFVTNELPRRGGSGQTIRDFQLMRYLTTRHQFTVLCFDDVGARRHTAELAALGIPIESVPRPVYDPASIWVRRRDTAISLLHPLPQSVRALRSSALKRKAAALIGQARFDLAHIAHTEMADVIPGAWRLPRVIGTDAITPKMARSVALLSKPTHRLWRRIETLKLAHYERSVIRESDLFTVASEREAAWAREQAPSARIAVIPNGVDTGYFKPMPDTTAYTPTILFIGTFSYEPNTDGILWFCRDIYPSVRAEVPSVRLLIVGREPPPAVQALAALPGVAVTGFVDDVRPYIAQSTIVVVPLRNGGGTRLKILEALAMGKAVISTSIGAEGLDVTHDRDILIADTPDAFCDVIVRLFGSDAMRRRLGEDGRRLVEHSYGWDGIASRLDAVYRQVVGAGC